MERLERMLIEHECTRLVNKFHHLFNRDLSAIADLFTEDGIADLGRGQGVKGRDTIREVYSSGGKDMKSRKAFVMNTVTNIVIDVIDENNATGYSYDIFWQYIYPGEKHGTPAPVPLPMYLGYWLDEFKCVDSEWKFSSRKLRFMFDRRRWTKNFAGVMVPNPGYPADVHKGYPPLD
jgi:hypothetical protein